MPFRVGVVRACTADSVDAGGDADAAGALRHESHRARLRRPRRQQAQAGILESFPTPRSLFSSCCPRSLSIGTLARLVQTLCATHARPALRSSASRAWCDFFAACWPSHLFMSFPPRRPPCTSLRSKARACCRPSSCKRRPSSCTRWTASSRRHCTSRRPAGEPLSSPCCSREERSATPSARTAKCGRFFLQPLLQLRCLTPASCAVLPVVCYADCAAAGRGGRPRRRHRAVASSVIGLLKAGNANGMLWSTQRRFGRN